MRPAGHFGRPGPGVGRGAGQPGMGHHTLLRCLFAQRASLVGEREGRVSPHPLERPPLTPGSMRFDCRRRRCRRQWVSILWLDVRCDQFDGLGAQPRCHRSGARRSAAVSRTSRPACTAASLNEGPTRDRNAVISAQPCGPAPTQLGYRVDFEHGRLGLGAELLCRLVGAGTAGEGHACPGHRVSVVVDQPPRGWVFVCLDQEPHEANLPIGTGAQEGHLQAPSLSSAEAACFGWQEIVTVVRGQGRASPGRPGPRDEAPDPHGHLDGESRLHTTYRGARAEPGAGVTKLSGWPEFAETGASSAPRRLPAETASV